MNKLYTKLCLLILAPRNEESVEPLLILAPRNEESVEPIGKPLAVESKRGAELVKAGTEILLAWEI